MGVRSTDLSSIYQVFVNDVNQLLMDPGNLTATEKVLLMFSKLKDFLKQAFSNITVQWNHLGSLNNTAAWLSHAVSLISLLSAVN